MIKYCISRSFNTRNPYYQEYYNRQIVLWLLLFVVSILLIMFKLWAEQEGAEKQILPNSVTMQRFWNSILVLC